MFMIFIVAPYILTTLMFLSQTNAFVGDKNIIVVKMHGATIKKCTSCFNVNFNILLKHQLVNKRLCEFESMVIRRIVT